MLKDTTRGVEHALWGVVGITLLAAVVFLASVPLSTPAQAVVAICAVIVVALLKPAAHVPMVRYVLLATASFIVLRYLFWRISYTLPFDADIPSQIAAYVLLMAELQAVCVFFLSAFVTAQPADRPLPPIIDYAEELPTVDVLVPSYNEPADMLSVTLAAASMMRYPRDRLKVILCDDGGTDQRCNHSDPDLAAASRRRRAELQEMCKELGVIYATRERNVGAKAGNMSSALENLDGELVVVLDADHVPTQDFLERTVGHFIADPKLFLVQTPHFFINKDPIERNLGLAEKCPPENEMFYGIIQPGIDNWGSTLFCGSAAILRRQALDEAGGFAGESITEDAETALDIHARGWHSMYVNHAVIAGLQPETFSSFIGQRSRWASGMMQIFLLKNPIFKRGLTIYQRLCYLNMIGFWLFPLVRMVFLCAPLAYLFFGLEIFSANVEQFSVYVLSYLVVSLLVQNTLFRRYRWPLISELYETAQTPYLARAVLSTFWSPRSPSFNVTSKDETLDKESVSPIARPLIILFLLMVAGVAAGITRYALFPGDRDAVTIVTGWAIFNFVVVGTALGAVCEKPQRRARPRVSVREAATLHTGDGLEYAATLLDVSMGGTRIEVPLGSATKGAGSALLASLRPGQQVTVRPLLKDEGAPNFPILCHVASVQRSPHALIVGLSYAAQQARGARFSVASIMFRDSLMWQAKRLQGRNGPGLVMGVLYYLWLAIRTIPASVMAIIRDALSPKPDNTGEIRAVIEQAHPFRFGVEMQPSFADPAPQPVGADPITLHQDAALPADAGPRKSGATQ
ncbi:UDP-forming cellulose synthase catalytic subunit [Oceanicella sp. SM1341]|uniref:UDP-forming cellulose synthase catalytic subunit n=1 Tax=Oceanicella sp. SM1341 TaxID=1548889 RepID=UPI000E4DD2D7|nr:UDP-forming cellulose synthase catalytic subunit [Oceanicella sp. SM1341]